MAVQAEIKNKVTFNADQASIAKVNNEINKLKSTALKALGMIGIGMSLRQLVAISEEFNAINDRINYAVGYAENMKETQQEILEAANRCKQSYGQMADAIVSLKQANADMFPIEEATEFVEYVNKLGKAAGYSAGEINSLQNMIQRAAAYGTVSAQMLNRMAMSTPALIEQVCNSLGVTREELNQMAAEGKVTAQTIKDAILSSKDEIDKSFSQLDYSISDAMLHIRNEWGFWVDDINHSLKITENIAKLMTKGFDTIMVGLNKVRDLMMAFADKVGGTENLFKLLAIAAAAFFVVMNWAKITAAAQGFLQMLKLIFGLFSAGGLKKAAIIAAIIAIALVIEDFINFLQGNDSVIGLIFDKLGIGSENARQAIFNAFGKARDFLLTVWGSIKTFLANNWDTISAKATTVFNAIGTLIQYVFDGVSAFWDRWGSRIIAMFNVLWTNLGTYLQGFLDIVMGVITFLTGTFTGDWDTAWSGVQQIFSGAWDMITSFLSSCLEVISTLIEVVLTTISENWESIWNGIKDFYLGLLNAIKGIISDFLNNAQSSISSIWNSIYSFFTGILNRIKQFFLDIWNNLSSETRNWLTEMYNKIKETWNNVLSAISSIIGNIYTTIYNGFQNAVNYIKSLPSQAFAWGRDIVGNLISGIQNKIGALKSKANELASAIGDRIHFSKPDEGPLSDFDTYMPDMMKGLADGIRRNMGIVIAAVEELTGGMSMALTTKVNPSTASAAVGQTYNNNRSVSQNVNINNTFNGERAVQMNAEKAMNSAVEDVTSELARAIDFTR